MQYRLQAAGYAGGWFAWGTDTEQELAQKLPPALAAQGLTVRSVSVSADEWDVSSRVFSNQFHYRADIVVESPLPADAVTLKVETAVEFVTGIAATISNLTAGDDPQSLPDSNPLPGIGDALSGPLALVAVIVVAVAVFAIVER